MRVADIMISPVIGIAPTASIAEAAQVMLNNRVSGLPVISHDRHLVGIVTESDFLRRVELSTQKKRTRWLELFRSTDKLAEEYAHNAGRKIADVMTSNVISISPDSSLEKLADLMQSRHIKRVPVVGNGKLVGIVSRADLMRAMLRLLPDTNGPAQSDEDIRREILADLARQLWIGSSNIRVNVHRGVVDLSGTISHESQSKAAHILAENVVGVSAVTDHLAVIEPMSGVYIIREGE